MPASHENCYKVSMIIVCVLAAPFLCVYGICTCGYRCLESHFTGKPMAAVCGTGHRAAMMRWDLKKALKKEAPDPLPAKRKRALTIPDVSPKGSVWKRRKPTSGQLQSIFFERLPLEIRDMIYAFTLASADSVHIYRRADRRLGHCICQQDCKKCLQPLRSDQTITWACDVRQNPDRDRDDLLSLLMTCRRMSDTTFAS